MIIRVLKKEELPPPHRRMSWSRLSNMQACPYNDHMQRRLELIPKYERAHFRKGRMVHRYTESHFTGEVIDDEEFIPSDRNPEQEWADRNEAYWKDVENAKSASNRVVEYLSSINFRPACLKELGLSDTPKIAVEESLAVELDIGSPNPWAWKQVIDFLGYDDESGGELVLWDLKSTGSRGEKLGEVDGVTYDPQMGLYSHCLRLLGVEVGRTRILRVRSLSPETPRMLKSGRPTWDKRECLTTVDMWMDTAKAKGVDGEKYRDEVEARYSSIEWIRPYEAYTKAKTDAIAWEDMKNVARHFDAYERGGIRPPRYLSSYRESACRTANPAKKCLNASACFALLEGHAVPRDHYLPHRLQDIHRNPQA